MFITPMPPTTKEMTAMEEISSVMVPVVLSTISLMLSLLFIKKSSVPWRAFSSSVRLFSATCVLASSLILTTMELVWLSPVIWCMTVV